MTLFTLNNFVHQLTAIVWVGGMIYTNFVFMPSLNAIEPSQRGKMLGEVAKKFTIISWASMFVLLLTGIYKMPEGTWFQTSNNYALMLTIKHILFVIMILVGSVITFVVAPKLRNLAPKPGEKPAEEFIKAQKQIKILSSTNMILGIVIIFAVSLY